MRNCDCDAFPPSRNVAVASSVFTGCATIQMFGGKRGADQRDAGREEHERGEDHHALAQIHVMMPHLPGTAV